jgi:hypothetical protein
MLTRYLMADLVDSGCAVAQRKTDAQPDAQPSKPATIMTYDKGCAVAQKVLPSMGVLEGGLGEPYRKVGMVGDAQLLMQTLVSKWTEGCASPRNRCATGGGR